MLLIAHICSLRRAFSTELYQVMVQSLNVIKTGLGLYCALTDDIEVFRVSPFKRARTTILTLVILHTVRPVLQLLIYLAKTV